MNFEPIIAVGILASAFLAGAGTARAEVPLVPPPTSDSRLPTLDAPLPNPQSPPTPAPTYSVQTEWFEITAPTPALLNHTAELARALERAFTRQFAWQRNTGTTRIATAILLTAATATTTGTGSTTGTTHYIELNRDTGRTTLSLHLPSALLSTAAPLSNSAPLTSALLSPLARALLVRASKAEFPAAPKIAPPEWLINALVLETQIEISPALLEWHLRQLRQAPPPPLSQITAVALPSTNKAIHHSSFVLRNSSAAPLWLTRLLRRALDSTTPRTRSVPTDPYRLPPPRFFAALATGNSLEHLIDRHIFSPNPTHSTFELWWQAGAALLARETVPFTQSPDESEKYLFDALQFTLAPTDTDEIWSPPLLAALRPLSTVRNAARLRLDALLRDLPRANPVWHNAWLAYGRYLAAFINPDTPITALAPLWKTTENEISTARQTASEITALLAAP